MIPMDEKVEGDPQLRSAMELLTGQTVARPRTAAAR
jgi:hypothetical protein